MADDKPKLWVRVVEAHATRTYVAVILAAAAGLSLFTLVIAATWNTIANPDVTDLSANFMTVISGALGVLLGGLSSFLGVPSSQTRPAKPGEFPVDDDIVLDIDPPDESP